MTKVLQHAAPTGESKRKGGRPATGSLSWRRNPRTGAPQWFAQITLADGSRPLVELDPGIKEADRSAAAACALTVSKEARGRAAVSVRNIETLTEFSVRWLAARVERGLTSVRDDRGRLVTHVLPNLGARDVRTITRDDLEELVERLDGKVRAGGLSWKTAIHTWGLVTRLFADACGAKRRDLRVRDDDPAISVHGPDRGLSKAKVYLYPSEFTQLVECAQVPHRWRRMFALTTYFYARCGEINALTWEDIDLERGVAHIHCSASRRTGENKSTKTGATRRVPIEKALAPLLRAMHAEAGGIGRVSPVDATDKKTSRQLQRCLRLARLKRADLFADDATRKPMTFHDLRSTGITWCAVRGDEPLRIKQRAGHATFSTTEGYIREAENLRETNFGTPFPPLPDALLVRPGQEEDEPEMEPCPDSQQEPQLCETDVTNQDKNRGSMWRRRESNSLPEVSNSAETSGKAPTPEASPPTLVPNQDGSLLANAETHEPTGIEHALSLAAVAGRWDVVALLAKELESRRLGTMANVVQIGTRVPK